MLAPELPYSDCTDPLCLIRTCTPCSIGIKSCCRRTVLCPHSPELHACPTQRRDV